MDGVAGIQAPQHAKKPIRSQRARKFIYGDIPGIKVGATFADRDECRKAGIHVMPQAGIHGARDSDGASSVVMSGGYEDDEDTGETFIYSGEGGRQGRQQVANQEWTSRGNDALMMSYCTGNPVRVVRGQQAQSAYAPLTGYRYDGLYEVVGAERKKGKTGFITCQFSFRRLPDQAPLPEIVTYEERAAVRSAERRRRRAAKLAAATAIQEAQGAPTVSEEQPLAVHIPKLRPVVPARIARASHVPVHPYAKPHRLIKRYAWVDSDSDYSSDNGSEHPPQPVTAAGSRIKLAPSRLPSAKEKRPSVGGDAPQPPAWTTSLAKLEGDFPATTDVDIVDISPVTTGSEPEMSGEHVATYMRIAYSEDDEYSSEEEYLWSLVP